LIFPSGRSNYSVRLEFTLLNIFIVLGYRLTLVKEKQITTWLHTESQTLSTVSFLYTFQKIFLGLN